MTDRDWLAPSIALTVASGLIAIFLIPDYAGVMPAVMILPYWMLASAVLASICWFLSMLIARVDSPIAHMRKAIANDPRRAGLGVFCIFLAGINMTTFMWTKPLLNYLVPFWADPLLANVDHAVFFGRDPWTLLTWLNSTPAAIFYHRGWFALMIVTLVIVLAAPPSPRKSAVMLTYFALWSVVGPLVHSTLPAAGPIFFDQLGYGNRFSDLHSVSETKDAATYLWAIYSSNGFGPGSGISAMPSLHIATTAWMMIAVHIFARRLMMPMAIAGIFIFLLSIALGWHYAADGIVGAGCAVLCFQLLHKFYRGRRLLASKLAGNPADSRATPIQAREAHVIE